MSERPTQTPASSASEAQASRAPKPLAPRAPTRLDERRGTSPPRLDAARPPAAGDSVAVRAERFRNGAPFLVERAILYDPDPLDLPVAPADRRARPPRSLLPAALTLLGVVVVFGVAAGILFVRNAGLPRIDAAKGQGKGRLEQFSERVAPTGSPPSRSPDATTRRDQVTYDLTKRSNDTIIGAWREPKHVKAPPVEEIKPVVVKAPVPEAAPEVVAVPKAAPPRGFRRLMPRRLSGWLAKRKSEQTAEQVAEPAVPQSAPLDDPYELSMPRSPLDEPHVPKSTVATGRSAQPPPAKMTVAAPPKAADPTSKRAAASPEERQGGNIVARVGRADDPKDRDKARKGGDDAESDEPSEAEKAAMLRERYAARRARRAELRRLREARRQAIDLDRFLVREKGDVPYGFVFSGPQAQRP